MENVANLTHWKKLTNPDYLSACEFRPGEDMIVTVKSVVIERVTSPQGEKEDKPVVHFLESAKPLVLNKTNGKTIAKILKTQYIEQWIGRRIQLYVDNNVKAFGETVDGVRVRPFLPREEIPVCVDCGREIGAYGTRSAKAIALYTEKKYGKALCNECAKKLADKANGGDGNGSQSV